jgi:Rieske Fe-S protein
MSGRSSSGRPSEMAASRRTVLGAAVAAPVAGLGLAACGPGGSQAGPSEPVTLGPESDVSAIPQGGAKLYGDQKTVVSKAEDGTLKAYSTVCTHAGCAISKLDGTTLTCPCHNSRFDATTGKVLQSPATEPLAELSVKTEGGKVVVGPK